MSEFVANISNRESVRATTELRNSAGETRLYLAGKRLFDVTAALLALILLSPLFLILALVIFGDDPHGSPIFSQLRVGKDGKTFRFYKFRSMVTNAEELLEQLKDRNEMEGPAFKIKDDPRITRVGKFIRKTSLDELPQLINVIRGDMSLVGPRPPLPREVEQYTPQQMRRLTVTPGLTCYWQATPRRNELTFDQWLALDLKYIRERGMGTDIRILLDTALAVANGEGV